MSEGIKKVLGREFSFQKKEGKKYIGEIIVVLGSYIVLYSRYLFISSFNSKTIWLAVFGITVMTIGILILLNKNRNKK